MKQRLGEKKHKRCEAVTGRTYRGCYTRGGWGHFWAECWFGGDTGEPARDADMVNYRTGEHYPDIRAGQRVPR